MWDPSRLQVARYDSRYHASRAHGVDVPDRLTLPSRDRFIAAVRAASCETKAQRYQRYMARVLDEPLVGKEPVGVVAGAGSQRSSKGDGTIPGAADVDELAAQAAEAAAMMASAEVQHLVADRA